MNALVKFGLIATIPSIERKSALVGSSSYQLTTDGIIEKKIPKRKNMPKYLEKLDDRLGERYEYAALYWKNIEDSDNSFIDFRVRALELIRNCRDSIVAWKEAYSMVGKRERKVNVKALRGKVSAMFSLSRAKGQLKFVTISFPPKLTNDAIKRVSNLALTWLRKECKIRHYIWITELQPNTRQIHYHIALIGWIPIIHFNRLVGKMIDREIAKGNGDWGNSSLHLYNGVDLKCIKGYGKKGDKNGNISNVVALYLSKYMGKEVITWRCSSCISALATGVAMNLEDYELEQLRSLPDVKIFKKEYCAIYLSDSMSKIKAWWYLIWINNEIDRLITLALMANERRCNQNE